MRNSRTPSSILLALFAITIVIVPSSAENAPAVGCNGAWTAEEFSGDCGPYDQYYRTATETYQSIASPCPSLPANCEWATREDFGKTLGWYNIYKEANYTGTGDLNPWWYRILERDHGDWFYEQCPYQWTSQCPQQATLNKQYFNIYLDTWGPPESGALPTIPSADTAFQKYGDLNPLQHSAMVCGADPATGGPLSGATIINITSGFNAGSCSQTVETLYGTASGTEGQASLSVSQGYTTSFEVSTESDSSFGWSVGVTVSVSEGGDISPVKSEQAVSASVSGTVSSSSTTTNSTSVQNLKTQTVVFDVKDGYTCSVDFVVTSCRSTYSYSVPLVLTGSFRAAWWKCDNNGQNIANPYPQDPEANQNTRWDKSVVLDDYWIPELRQTSKVTFSGVLTSMDYGQYNATCYLTNPPQPPAVSQNGKCGAVPNQTCMGSPAGSCCSANGICGTSSLACTQTFDSSGTSTGCQSGFGSCTLIPSKSGDCGPSTSQTCSGSGLGDCCSPYGNCGDGNFFCGTGCQDGFGLCGNVTTSSSTSPASSATIPVSSSTSFLSSISTTVRPTTTSSANTKTTSLTNASPKPPTTTISSTSTASSPGASATKALTAACASDYECASGWCLTSKCANSSNTGPKVAVPGHCHTDYNCGASALCYGNQTPNSSDSYVCVKTNTTVTATKCTTVSQCPSGAGCRSGGCYPFKYNYDPCTQNSDCSSGTCSASSLTCVPSSTSTSSSFASPPVTTTARTTTKVPSSTIIPTTSATTSSSASGASSTKAVGVACTSDYQCASLWCLTSKCANSSTSGPKVAVPGHCHTDYNCGSSALCYGNQVPNSSDSFICMKTNTTVTATKCTAASQCPSGAGCRSGACYPYKFNFDPCLQNSDCSSGICSTTAFTCSPGASSTPSSTFASPSVITTKSTTFVTTTKASTVSTTTITQRATTTLGSTSKAAGSIQTTTTASAASSPSPTKALNAACASDYECASLWCLSSKCANSSTSGPKVAVPGHCHTDYNCGSSALCFGNGKPNSTDSFACVKTNTTTTSTKCSTVSQCPTGAGCRSGACYPYKLAFDPCLQNSDCSGGVCTSSTLVCSS